MDLSNLSSNLPPTKPVDQSSINELNRELITEFKNAAKSVAMLYNSSVSDSTPSTKQKTDFANAAKSVASLYKLSTSSTSLLKYNGYLNCLDDMLEVIAHGGDIENWVLAKRAELTNTNTTHNNIMSSPERSANTEAAVSSPILPVLSDEELQIPLDFKFTASHEIKPKHPFVPSYPPLSVQHDRKKPVKERKEIKKDQKKNEKSDQENDDAVAQKRRKIKNQTDAIELKKKWKKNSDMNS